MSSQTISISHPPAPGIHPGFHGASERGQNTFSGKDCYLSFFLSIGTPWIMTACMFMETLININIWWKPLQEGQRGRVKGHGFFLAGAQSSHSCSVIYTVRAHSTVKRTHRMVWKSSPTGLSLEWVCMATTAVPWRYCVHITLGETERQPALLQDIYTTIE